jgi:hypothetical protein
VNVATVENIPAGKDQPQLLQPKAGITDQVVVNPNAGLYDTNGMLVTTESLAFHELAEAYSKVDESKPYSDFEPISIVNGTTVQIGLPQTGAHNEAVIREYNLRKQQPSLKTTGRAGDMLHTQPQQIIRNPH